MWSLQLEHAEQFYISSQDGYFLWQDSMVLSGRGHAVMPPNDHVIDSLSGLSEWNCVAWGLRHIFIFGYRTVIYGTVYGIMPYIGMLECAD